MKYIESFREGERISGIYLCKNRQNAVTKTGKAYENVVLQDKTGTADAKIWDPNSQGIDDFSNLDYVDIVADVTSFQGQMQLNIKRVRKANVPGAAWICGKGKESVPVPAAQKSFRGRQGICKGIQIQQCGKNRASRICGRPSGTYLKCYQTL